MMLFLLKIIEWPATNSDYLCAPKALLLIQFNKPASPPLPCDSCSRCARISSIFAYWLGSLACLLLDAVTVNVLCLLHLCLLHQTLSAEWSVRDALSAIVIG